MTKTLIRRVGALENRIAPITRDDTLVIQFVTAKDGAPDPAVPPQELVLKIGQTRRRT